MNPTKYQLPPLSQLGGYSLSVAQRVKYLPEILTIPCGFAWREVLKQLVT